MDDAAKTSSQRPRKNVSSAVALRQCATHARPQELGSFLVSYRPLAGADFPDRVGFSTIDSLLDRGAAIFLGHSFLFLAMGLQRMLPLALLSCAMGRQRARALAVRGGDKVPLRGGFAYGGQKKPVFYDMTHSNNAARVRLWLRLVDPSLSKQVDSTFITYDDLRSEEYGRLNPLRKVPALVRGDGGTVFESDVILKYLAAWNSNVGRPTLSP
jgi:hypothetical protein